MRKISYLSFFLCFSVFTFVFIDCSRKKQIKEFILIEDLRIRLESGDERFVLAGIDNIALDSEENIYISDDKNYRIQIFDRDGNFLKSIEIKKGEGPQEVTLIHGMALTEKGKIYIQDYNGTKILLFDKSGQFINSYKIEFQAINIIPYSEETVAILGLNDDHVFHIFNTDGSHIESFGEPFEIPNKHSQFKNISQLKLPRRADRSRNGKIFLVNPHLYEIRIYEDKGIRQIIKHESESFSPLEIRHAKKGNVGMAFPWVPVIEHENRIYATLRKFGKDTIHKLEIFEENKHIYSLSVKGYAYAIDNKGRLYFAEMEEEFPQMVRYLIEAK